MIAPVGGFDLRMLHCRRLCFIGAKWGFEDLPRRTYGTITAFVGWMSCIIVVIDDFCGWLRQLATLI
ncbi:hypothetical protein JCGZ_12647 [Jatropha curcas]|uniref:Uncharacterized protein n=1 Tax=Jatropha curcas TaxID=180498 RepID=A0A067KR62_JATCU|nr:hypothetical protein JCGZ_12647 [Jatropha curcas]